MASTMTLGKRAPHSNPLPDTCVCRRHRVLFNSEMCGAFLLVCVARVKAGVQYTDWLAAFIRSVEPTSQGRPEATLGLGGGGNITPKEHVVVDAGLRRRGGCSCADAEVPMS